MASKYWGVISDFIHDWDTDILNINPSYAPKQKDIIQLINLYWMNKFQNGDSVNGLKKSFFNVIINPTEVAQKMIDLDTKDINVIAENGASYYPAWMFEKDLRVWMKSKKNSNQQTFGQLLNAFVYNWPKMGHLLVKKVKDTVNLVPLDNVINKQNAQSILASDLVIEEHQYTEYQLNQQPWDKDKIKYIIKHYKKNDEGKYVVYEVHGDITTGDNYVIIPKDCKDDKEILYSTTIDRNDLYKELKWDDIPGRALGRGRPELLFEDQIAKNQVENMFRDALRSSSKRLFQSRDETLARNLITAVDNGDILTALSPIEPIAMEMRNLQEFNWSDQKWDSHTNRLGFAYSEVSGERSPAGTPLGSQQLNTAMISQYYDLKKEDFGMFIKDILFDWIIPEFNKQKKNEHGIMTSEFDEDELSKLRNLIINNRVNREVVRYIGQSLKIPSREEYEIIKSITAEEIKRGKEITIPKNYYENMEYKIDIVITNEQIDVASKLTTLQTVLQIIGSNPTVLQEPRTRKVFYKLIDLAGFSPVDFGIDESDEGIEQTMMNQAKVGGSIARTATPSNSPTQINQSQRL